MKLYDNCEESDRRSKRMENKCRYCNKEIIEKETYCSIKCKTKAEAYNTFVKRFETLFLVLVVMFVLAISAQLIFFRNALIIARIAMFGLGLTIFVFPFNDIIDKLGIKRSLILMRGVAISL